MINTDDLYIINYCHPNCEPLKNIMRLPKDEAFAFAQKMAENNTETTAFYRFADFKNYYPRRIAADKIVHDTFISLGGKPKTEHPLSFVLQGSDYLNKWFDDGIVTKIMLKDIPNEYISFTYGDSMAVIRKKQTLNIITKDMLLDSIGGYPGTIDDYMSEIAQKHYYIEVQLWNDEYCTK